ncbi:hypothetical protein BaRGS_00013388 [Batillaria attramentaria]|uniref:HEPN domain-containing protein n=1 Tax=Batillaria attramentaria TaxID=370345 RepID=A0ABD0L766_9CAEN
MVETFGVIRPNLIQDIRQILTEYPDNGQILKEMIQNAEDARAKTVKIVTDRRYFNRNFDVREPISTEHPYASFFMGPALCVYNDEIFSDDDWQGICMLHLSIKEKDPLKVGRFGLGFKSVFHLTDRVVILSGDYVLYMNPFEDEKMCCTRVHIAHLVETEQAVIRYCVEHPMFGISERTFVPGGGGFQGSLFWFPLRQTPSELSGTVYNDQRLDDLLNAFKGEMSSMLLFLKNIEHMEVYSRDSASEMTPLMSVSLSPECLEIVRRERKAFLTAILAQDGVLPTETLCRFSQVTVETKDHSKYSRDKQGWIVVSYYPDQRELNREESELCMDPSLSYRPCVGIALPIERSQAFQGQIFCTLPLPVETRSATGLPVHVNGYFALSQNRNHLKWPDQLRLREHLESSVKWNLLLVEVLLPKAYARLLEWLPHGVPVNPQQFYGFWPDMSTVTEHWRPLAERLYQDIANRRAFFTEANGGQWIALSESILRQFPQEVPADIAETVAKVYKLNNQNLVELPRHVVSGLNGHRCLFNVTGVRPNDVSRLVQHCLLSRAEKLHVLEYLCSQRATLVNLKLLPLANGTFGSFAGGQTVYFCDDNLLLLFPGLEAEFVDATLSPALRVHLCSLAQSGLHPLGILKASDPAVPNLISRSLQIRFKSSQQPMLLSEDTWVQNLWQFLSSNFPWSSDLGDFKGLSLLPLAEGSRLKLLPLSGIYISTSVMGMRPLHTDLMSCLNKFGITVITELPLYVTKHSGVLGGLVQYPSLDGIMVCLGKICADQRLKETAAQNFNKSATAAERAAIAAMISETRALPEKVKQFFCVLKLFAEAGKHNHVSVKEVNMIAPSELPPEPLPWRFLDGSCEHAASKLGARKVSLVTVVSWVLQFIISNKFFSRTGVDNFMSYLLTNEDLLNDQSLLRLAKQVKFLPTASGSLRTAGELYDPTSSVLQKLFASEDKFPIGKFCQADLLPKLRKLGLRGESTVGSEDLLSSACRIQNMLTTDPSTAKGKAEGVWELLKRYGETIHCRDCNILGKLSQINCLPNLEESERPGTYPRPMTVCQPGIFKPQEMCHFHQLNLVGSVLPVLKPDMSQQVAQNLHVGTQAYVHHVLQHLDNVIGVFRLQTTGVKQKHDYSCRKTQQDAITDIYKCLAQHLTGNRSVISSHMSSKASVWTSAGFVAPWRVAFRNDHDCSPYLFQLEQAFQQYRPLFEAIGVQEDFGIDHGKYVLRQIQEETKGQRLSQEKMNLVIRAAQLVCGAVNRTQTKKSLDGKDVFLPDQQSIMRCADSLCFRDSPWMNQSRQADFVHNSISPEIAGILGVKTRNRKIYSGLVKAMPFGQKERLTDRIVRLLRGYTFDSSLLKELIQNADDAGATEIKFIKSFRYFGTEGAPEGWEKLQGPALCVYNNRSFTSQDMEGIHNLGRGSKGSDLLKTGQYGVGFNAVYHITDTPSFWTIEDNTKKVICVFDPTCRYLPNLDSSEPGVKFEVDELEQEYPDLVAAYTETGIDMNHPGTLFRFPLRTEEMAQFTKTNTAAKDDEKWPSKPITCDKISRLLLDFSSEMGLCLLFLNNITSIGVYSVSETGVLQLEYSVEKALEERQAWKLLEHKHLLTEVSRKMEDEALRPTEIEVSETVVQLKLKDSRNHIEDWLIVNRIGFKDIGEFTEEQLNAWDKEQEQGKLVPRGGVAVQLSGRPFTSNTSDCQAFCMLPLPVHTGLPMHVNGHFALGHETRRGLWDNKGDARTEWNKAIALQVLVPAYMTAIKRVKNEWFQTSSAYKMLTRYHNLFPDVQQARSEFWGNLMQYIYKQIARQELCLFPVVRSDLPDIQWVAAVSSELFPGYFVHRDRLFPLGPTQHLTHLGSSTHAKSTNSEVSVSKEETFLEVLKKLGMCVLDSPHRIFRHFLKSGIDNVREVSPGTVKEFLKSADSPYIGGCNVGSLPCPVQHTPFETVSNVTMFLQFLKQDPGFLGDLEGLPLCLRQSEDLYIFKGSDSTSRPIASRFFHMLPGSSSWFLHEKIFRYFLSISKDAEIMVQSLSIPMFAHLLPNTLSKTTNGNLTLAGNLSWKPWLHDVWSFLEEQLSVHLHGESKVIRNKVEAELQCLSKWHLIPVRRQNESLLLLVRNMQDVIYLSPSPDESNPGLWETLRSMQLPFLDTAYLPPQSIATKLVASINDPAALLEALTSNGSSLTTSKGDAVQVLSYFSVSLPTLRSRCPHETLLQQKLRSLPFFVGTDGNIRSIAPTASVICLSGDVPCDGLADWSRNRLEQVVLLQKEYVPDRLCNILGFTHTTVEQFYCKHLLPTIDALPRNAILPHMVYLKGIHDHCFMPEAYGLCEQLKSTAFIEFRGTLHPASHFLSPEVPVFRLFYPNDCFPPAPYADPEWIAFMSRAGIVSEVTDKMFVELASILQDENGARVTENVKLKSDELVRNLFQKQDLARSSLLEQIKAIRFIRSSDWRSTTEGHHLEAISEPFSGKTLVSFQESCSERHLHLVWTTRSVIHPSADLYSLRQFLFSDDYDTVLDKLSWQKEAPSDEVIEHTVNVCSDLQYSIAAASDIMSTVDKVMTGLYEYLDRNLDDLDLTVLADLAIICDLKNKQMLRPENVVVRLSEDEEVADFIHEMPHRYGKFEKLFQSLGVSERVTANHYARILAQLEHMWKGKHLNTETLRIVGNAIQGLLKCLKSKSEAQQELTLDTVFLPSEHCILVRSADLVFKNNEILGERCAQLTTDNRQFFLGFRKMGISGHSDDIRALPVEHQMTVLSDIVKEVVPDHIRCAAQESETSRNLSEKLSNLQFVAAVIRLAFHQFSRESKADGEEFNEETEESIKVRLSLITVKEVTGLKTVVYCEGTQVKGSEIITSSFIELQEGEEGCTVYFDASTGTLRQKDTTRCLAQAVQIVLNFDPAHICLLADVFESPAEASGFMDGFKIAHYDCRISLGQSFSSSLGIFVPVPDHCLLDYRLENEFSPGDCVAFEVYDPAIDGDGDDESASYIYAVVVRKSGCNSDEDTPAFLQRYIIDIGPEQGGEREVPATRLYRLLRAPESHAENFLTSLGEPDLHLDEEDILPEILQIVSTAWLHQWQNQSEELEKWRVVKRMYMQWHPGMNTGYESVCEKVTRGIQTFVRSLNSKSPATSMAQRGQALGEASRSRNPAPQMIPFEDNALQTEDVVGAVCKSGAPAGYDDAGRAHTANPQPGEALRWFRQAEQDLEAARNSVAGQHWNWVCYQCHQALEKALKAVMYNRDACQVSRDHELCSLASRVGDSSLSMLANRLQSIVGEHTRMRYPDVCQYPKIPAEVYDNDAALVACELTEQSLTRVWQFLEVSSQDLQIS